MINKIRYSFYSATILICLFILSTCSTPEDRLADFKGGVVTIDDFLNNYRNFLRVTGIKDNLSSRQMILNNVINEKLLLAELKKQNFEDSPLFRQEQDLIYQQLLLNHFYQNEILARITFSNRQLTDLFRQENTLYHIKQIFADDFITATEYSADLRNGKTFDDLIDNNPNWNEDYNKIDLGYISLADLNPRFRQTIIELPVGQISEPIKGKYGYTVLQAVDKKAPPILTEYEYAKQKPMLEVKLRNIISDSVMNAFTNNLAAGTDFSWEEENLTWLLNIFLEIKSKDDLRINPESTPFTERNICRINGKDTNLASLLPVILKSKLEHIKAVQDKDALKDFIAGSIIREEILAQAKQKQLNNTKEFLTALHLKSEKLKMNLWNNQFRDTVNFTRDDYDYFYRNFPDYFIIPTKRMVYEIRIKSEVILLEIKKRIVTGESFRELAKAYSEPRDVNFPDGFLGILSSADLGLFGPVIFSAQVNAVVGPEKYNDYYHLFMTTVEYPSQKLSLTEAQPVIDTNFHDMLTTRRMAKHFDSLALQYQVKQYYNVLKNVKFVDLKEKTI